MNALGAGKTLTSWWKVGGLKFTVLLGGDREMTGRWISCSTESLNAVHCSFMGCSKTPPWTWLAVIGYHPPHWPIAACLHCQQGLAGVCSLQPIRSSSQCSSQSSCVPSKFTINNWSFFISDMGLTILYCLQTSDFPICYFLPLPRAPVFQEQQLPLDAVPLLSLGPQRTQKCSTCIGMEIPHF